MVICGASCFLRRRRFVVVGVHPVCECFVRGGLRGVLTLSHLHRPTDGRTDGRSVAIHGDGGLIPEFVLGSVCHTSRGENNICVFFCDLELCDDCVYF